MLTEDNVIDAVRDHLEGLGWTQVNRSLATQRGVDLEMERHGLHVQIEAKGAGSSKAGTARFGQLFNSGQVFDHVAKAVLTTLAVISNGYADGAIALPSNRHHRAQIAKVAETLEQLGIGIFWVDDMRNVTEEWHWLDSLQRGKPA
jgi:hypothetical protein